MATVNQIYAMVNDASKEALGSQALSVKDTVTLVSLGNVVLSSDTNKEAFYKALTDRIGRTVIAARAYSATKRSVKRDEMDWGLIYQKISYRRRDAVSNPTWVDNAQADPFDVAIQTEAVQKLFAVMSTYSFEDSIPDGQLFTAFTNSAAMGAFISGIYTNMRNYMEQAEENLANLAVDTLIAGVLIKGTNAQKRYLLDEYNQKYSQNLTVDTCLGSTDFLKYATREISTTKDNMSVLSTVFNAEAFPRHTPADKCVVEVLGQFASACDTYLQADTYHNELVKLPNYEKVVYWQSPGTSGFAFADVSKINIENEHLAVTGNADGAIEQGGILALVRDYDAAASVIMRRRSASIYNPRAERFNIFEKADQGYAVDLSENAVVFMLTAPVNP